MSSARQGKARTLKACDEDESGVGPSVGRVVYAKEDKPLLYDAHERPLRRAIGFCQPQQIVVAPEPDLD